MFGIIRKKRPTTWKEVSLYDLSSSSYVKTLSRKDLIDAVAVVSYWKKADQKWRRKYNRRQGGYNYHSMCIDEANMFLIMAAKLLAN